MARDALDDSLFFWPFVVLVVCSKYLYIVEFLSWSQKWVPLPKLLACVRVCVRGDLSRSMQTSRIGDSGFFTEPKFSVSIFSFIPFLSAFGTIFGLRENVCGTRSNLANFLRWVVGLQVGF